jgi:hypothetical protein
MSLSDTNECLSYGMGIRASISPSRMVFEKRCSIVMSLKKHSKSSCCLSFYTLPFSRLRNQRNIFLSHAECKSLRELKRRILSSSPSSVDFVDGVVFPGDGVGSRVLGRLCPLRTARVA